MYDGEIIHYTKKDMANELVVWEAVKEVSGAMNSLVTTYRLTHSVNKAQKQALNIRIKEYLAFEKGRTIGEVSRNNVREIAKTMELINSLNLEGAALAMAMETLEDQHRQLKRLLEEC